MGNTRRSQVHLISLLLGQRFVMELSSQKPQALWPRMILEYLSQHPHNLGSRRYPVIVAKGTNPKGKCVHQAWSLMAKRRSRNQLMGGRRLAAVVLLIFLLFVAKFEIVLVV
jgi:hypothetical protein